MAVQGKPVRAVVCRVRWIEHDPPLVIDGEEYEATAEVSEPEVTAIEPTLENLQEIVGGHIEWVALGPRVGLYCHDEAMFHGDAPNRCGLLGTFVIVGSDGRGGERSLTDEEVRKALRWSGLGKHHLHPSVTGHNCGPTMTTYDSLEELQAVLDRNRRESDAGWRAL
jgi:hypothetical protein